MHGMEEDRGDLSCPDTLQLQSFHLSREGAPSPAFRGNKAAEPRPRGEVCLCARAEGRGVRVGRAAGVGRASLKMYLQDPNSPLSYP